MRLLLDGQLIAGGQSVVWDGKNDDGKQVANGMYLYKMNVNGKEVAVDKIIMIK